MSAAKRQQKANHVTIVKFIRNSTFYAKQVQNWILNNPSGKTNNQCSKLYQGNLANFRAAMVTHFQYGGST